MKKSELTALIMNSEKNIFAVVGPNTSGKSYYLNEELFLNLSDDAFRLDETGRCQIKGDRRKIKISGDIYIYEEEQKRGTGRDSFSSEKINDSSSKIINGIGKLISKVDTKNKSLGSSKLYNILSSIKSYNLNHIIYFLFDEPENSLDDEGMKCIEVLFNLLKDNGKKIFFITHSPRLLELLQIEIDNIYVFPKLFSDVINFSKQDIYDLFDENGNDLLKLIPDHPYSEPEKYYFLPATNLKNIYLEDLLKGDDFYRILFYSHIVIVEGKTEELIIRELTKDLSISKCIFNANGKYKIPFLFKLFSLYCEKITCIIDSDSLSSDGSTNFPYLLTKEIEKYKKTNKYFVFSVPKDIETYLSFDKSNIIEILTGVEKEKQSDRFNNKISSMFKPYLPLYVICNNMDARNKIKNLFNCNDDTFKF